MAGEVMGVFVAVAVAEVLHELGGGVAEVEGNGRGLGLGGKLHRLVDGHVGGVALGGGGEVDGRLGKGDAGFGHADVVHYLEAGIGKQEGIGVGEADVFGGKDA